MTLAAGKQDRVGWVSGREAPGQPIPTDLPSLSAPFHFGGVDPTTNELGGNTHLYRIYTLYPPSITDKYASRFEQKRDGEKLLDSNPYRRMILL